MVFQTTCEMFKFLWQEKYALLSTLIYSLGFAIPMAANAKLELGLKQSQYLSPAPEGQFDQYSDLVFRGNWSPESRNFKSQISVGGVTSLYAGEDQHFLVPELYVSTTDPITTWTLGRKKLPWSRFDQHWGFGLWEPHFKWDPLNPERQGLLGLIFEVRRANFQAHFFSSPLFLPDQGPSYVVRDGHLESSHRWIRRPLNTLTINSVDTDVIYRLDRPDVSDVIEQTSLGFWGRLGRKNMRGPWLQMALAMKPMNQFSVAIEGRHLLAAGRRSLVSEATIHPYVVVHRLVSVETGWSGQETEFWASVTGENGGLLEDLPEEWDQTPVGKSYYGGLYMSQSLKAMGASGTSVGLSYLRIENEYKDLPNTLVEGRAAGSLSRFPFEEAAQFTLKRAPRRLLGYLMAGSLRYLYSIREEGALLSAEWELWWTDKLKFKFGLDVLGYEGDDYEDGFFKRNQGNDRVQIGMSYAF